MDCKSNIFNKDWVDLVFYSFNKTVENKEANEEHINNENNVQAIITCIVKTF